MLAYQILKTKKNIHNIACINTQKYRRYKYTKFISIFFLNQF